MILLSARAGEAARVEGLEAGADDYLVKPFGARELLARVHARLEVNRLRREAARRERALLEETRTAKDRLDIVLRSISDGFIALDRDWRYVTVSDRACESMGMSREEILGRCLWDLYPATIGRPFETELRAIIEQKPSVFEYFYPAQGRWYENRLYPSADGLSIFFTEVTERRRTEEALRESEERFRNMADNAPVGIWVTDPAGHCTYVNEWWCRFTGTAPEESLGFGWLESVHPDDRRQAEATFRAANDRRGMFRAEYRVRGHDGDYRRVIDSAAPRLGPSGEYLGYIGSVIDVTEERRRQEALRRSEEMLAEAQQIAHIGSWSWDLESNEITWSDERYRIVGLRPQETPMTAERAASYIHWEDRTIAWESVRRAIRERQPYEWCLRMVREDGRLIIAQSRGRTVYDEAGKAVWMFGTIQDVTEPIRVEEACSATRWCWPTSATRSSPPTSRGSSRSGMKGRPASSVGPRRRWWDDPTPTASRSRSGRGSSSRSAPAPRARSGWASTRIITGTARGSGSMPASDGSRTRRAGRSGSSVSRGTSPNASGPRSNWPPTWPA